MPKKLFEVRANSFAQFRRALARAQEVLAQDPDVCDPEEFWYRGHDQGVHKLVPRLFRLLEPEQKEKRIFRLHAEATVGHSGSGPFSWDVVYRMQHYGIPTRLLDWTTKPLIAAFFALRTTRSNPCVWVLNPLRLNKANGLETIELAQSKYDFGATFLEKNHPIFHPLAVLPATSGPQNDRLRTQCGRFTAQGVNPGALEEQCSESLARTWLGKTACHELQGILADSNITAGTCQQV